VLGIGVANGARFFSRLRGDRGAQNQSDDENETGLHRYFLELLNIRIQNPS
jgi:hypothetical protein